MLGKLFVAIIAIFLLLGAFATPILDGVKTWRTDGLTTQNEIVATAAGVTTANVTLDKDLYQALLTQIDTITSTDGDDTPVATGYTEASLVLVIGGLQAETSRTLTIEYYGETDSAVMRAIGPFLGVLIIGGLLGGIAWGVFHKGGRR